MSGKIWKIQDQEIVHLQKVVRWIARINQRSTIAPKRSGI